MGEKAKAESKSARDIGAIPGVVSPSRRDACERDFKAFCETYFGDTFGLEWSDDHLTVIAKIERAVLQGELFAIAMPRGSGKTSLCEVACVWAIVYGHRRYVVLIGAEGSHAEQMIESIKSHIEFNPLLGEDFPAVCHPVRKLEGINQRAAGQLCEGQQTNILWRGDKIVMPTIKGSRSSGSILAVAGITGRIRGMKHTTAGGESIRPDLVLLDDPQTDESARSPTQCDTRERIVKRAVLGLAGPGKKIAGLMTVTVVEKGDLADRMLDREQNPEWQAERTKMVYQFPDGDEAQKLWRTYAEKRIEGLRAEKGLAPATRFYKRHRKKMDAGAKVAWPQRFDPGEISALQHAMNLKLADEPMFMAEYQNEPYDPLAELGENDLTVEQVMGLVAPYERGVVPHEAQFLTAHIDVQGDSLWWMVCAWAADFTGWVLDYGTDPPAKAEHYTLREVEKVGLKRLVPGEDGKPLKRANAEAAWFAGFERLAGRLLDRVFVAEGGGEMSVGQLLIDANYAKSKDTIHRWCRHTPHRSRVNPAHGRYVGAAKGSIMAAARKKGERLGHNWRMPPLAGGRVIRHVVFDTNAWKTFVAERLRAPEGSPGTLRIFDAGRREAHRVLAENFTAERGTVVEAKGVTVEEWLHVNKSRDNHHWDNVVGCAVAASMLGCTLGGEGEVRASRKRKRLSAAEMQRQARARSRRSA